MLGGDKTEVRPCIILSQEGTEKHSSDGGDKAGVRPGTTLSQEGTEEESSAGRYYRWFKNSWPDRIFGERKKKS